MKLARLLAPALSLALAAALCACSGSDATTPERYGVTVSMEGMRPHVGQLLEMRVVHAESNTEVGYTKIDPVMATDFLVSIPDVLIAGETYYIDFYADLNMDRGYDAPPVDHAWRFVRTATGPVSITFVHDTNWTDIDFPAHP
jgi:hypothetical protein